MGKKIRNRLASRLNDWKALNEPLSVHPVTSRTSSIDGMHYHKPGSQNPNK